VHYFEKLDPDPGSGSALKSKYKGFRGLKWSLGKPWTLTMEAWRLKMEPWRVYIIEQWSQICITLIRTRIQIRIQVKSQIQNRNTVK
jgi:hypothetical protein